MVHEAGLEPAPELTDWFLKPARLPNSAIRAYGDITISIIAYRAVFVYRFAIISVDLRQETRQTPLDVRGLPASVSYSDHSSARFSTMVCLMSHLCSISRIIALSALEWEKMLMNQRSFSAGTRVYWMPRF